MRDNQRIGVSYLIIAAVLGIVSSKTLLHECSGEKEFGLRLGGDEYILTSPRYPLQYSQEETLCQWRFKIPPAADTVMPRRIPIGAQYKSISSTINLHCDAFSVGIAQANGKCYGDVVYLMSPGNDTISLCGNRDGLTLKLQDYRGDLEIAFKSLNKSSFPGFSCRLKYGAEPQKIEQTELLNDSPCQCGLANSKGDDAPINRVINGQEALPNEFPWQVALVRAGGHTPICGGSIISDRHVLTAAHCTNDIKGIDEIEILVGEHDLLTNKDECQRYKLSRILEHPNYNEATVAFDFSLLVLKEKLQFSHYVRPICLPVLSYAMSQDQFADKLVTVSGWGLHTFTPVKNGHGPYAQRLNKLSGMKVLSNRQCQALWNERSEEYGVTSIISAMICAKKANSSACFGDSGGPLMYKSGNRHVLVGVVSYGSQTCVDPTLPTVYARVTDVLQWIFSVIKSANTCLPAESSLKAKVRHMSY